MTSQHLFISLLFFTLSTTMLHAQSPFEGRLIVIDPGHGTINYEGRIINPGKTNRLGHKEREITVQISQKLTRLLEKEGARVINTRTTFDFWRESYNRVEDNKTRAFFANDLGADVFISIHCDWHPRSSINGVTTFYAKNNSKRLGEALHRNMVTALKARDRKLVFDSYTVLDTAEMPSVLVETGFLSNRAEAKKLASPMYQTKVAEALTKGLRSYFSN